MGKATALVSNVVRVLSGASTAARTRFGLSVLFASLVVVVGSGSLLAAETPGRLFDQNAVAEFYKGKTVRIVVGFSPGGGFDINARVLARHLRNYIPGKPTVIIENRPGAGSLIAANVVYRTLPQDGTFIASFHPQLVLQQLLGAEQIEFDSRGYNWLGNLTRGQYVCAVHKETGITHIKQITGAAGRTVNMGGQAPGSGITDATALMRAALGLRFRIVYGYANAALIARAIQGRELDGLCISWEAWTSHLRHMFEPEQAINVLLAGGSTVPTHPWIDRNAVAAELVAPNERARKLLKVGTAAEEIAYPYALGPGVPGDRVAALRNAFDRTVTDPAFITDWEKTGRPLLPRKGEEVAGVVNEIFMTDRGLIPVLRDALGKKEGP